MPETVNAQCETCWGHGRAHVVIRDTRFLSDAALALYAGARRTRWGLEVLLNNQLKALELVGQHLGLWGPSKSVAPSGDPDPIQALINELRERHGADVQDHEPPPPSEAASFRNWRAVTVPTTPKAKNS